MIVPYTNIRTTYWKLEIFIVPVMVSDFSVFLKHQTGWVIP